MHTPAIQAFEAILEKHPGMDASFFTVPFSVQEVYGTKGQVKVKVTINGFTFPGLLAPMGKGFHALGIRKELRQKTGITFGDEVLIKLESETEPREIAVPADLEALLSKNPESKIKFEKLAYTHRREYVQWIEEAKKPETRQRRLEKMLEMLLQGKK